jgi:uncharacterized protein
MEIASEIEKLQKLKQDGAISEEEFEQAKKKLLEKQPTVWDNVNKAATDVTKDVNTWSMLIHLTQFCGYIVPVAGLVVPIILWQMKKNESEIIDRHGKIVTNWIISGLIYSLVGFLLVVLVIGIPILIALGVMAIVFPIVGGIKANAGEVWSYPLSIKFFK